MLIKRLVLFIFIASMILGCFGRLKLERREMDEEIIAPTLVQRIPPFYPEEARQKGWQGKVCLYIFVTDSGKVGPVRIASSSGHDVLDTAAVQYAKMLQFNPPLLHDKPINIWLDWKVVYNLEAGKPYFQPDGYADKIVKLEDQAAKVIEWKKEADPKTGYEVWQITSHDSASVACYFERQAFTADDRFIIFGSKRSAKWKLYRADLSTGEIVAIPSSEDVHPFAFTIHADGKNVCYMKNGVLYKTDVAKLKVDTLMNFRGRLPETTRFSSSFTLDSKYTLITTRSDSGQSIYRVNLFTGEIKHALTWKDGWFSHPLICPTNPDLITFVPGPDTQNDMTLPMEKRARTWIVDIKTGEVKQFLTMPYGFRATHESWSADGQRFFFYKKTQPGWIPVTICSINQNGEDWKEYYTHETLRLGHGVSSSDGRWFITDGQDPDHNPLMLIELATGRAITLCWPNASIREGHKKHAHVHPCFSLSGRFVCYTSNCTGTPQVYVVPMAQFFSNR